MHLTDFLLSNECELYYLALRIKEKDFRNKRKLRSAKAKLAKDLANEIIEEMKINADFLDDGTGRNTTMLKLEATVRIYTGD